jgi:hypothetical protein
MWKSSDFIKHETTRKHQNHLLGNINVACKEFTCEFCQKNYKSRNGLWKHNKKCTKETQSTNVIVKDNSDYLTNLVIEVVKIAPAPLRRMKTKSCGRLPSRFLLTNNKGILYNAHTKKLYKEI